MWHDDDGEDDPVPGPVPDPSARHWRHPSELGRQHGLPHPDPTPVVPLAPPGGAPSIVWPLTVLGGCIAAAALGVLILHLSGTPDAAIVTGAGSVATSSAVMNPADDALAVVGPQPTATTHPSSDSGATVTADPDAPADDDQEAGATPSVTAPTSPDGPIGGETSPTSPRRPGDEPSTPAPGVRLVGVYAAIDRDGVPLASFVLAGDHLLTSASSLGERTAVWLRVGDHWLKADVTATDALTDVALLTPKAPIDEFPIPVLEVAARPLHVGAPAMVGYGIQLDSDADGVPDTLIDPSHPDHPLLVDGRVPAEGGDDDERPALTGLAAGEEESRADGGGRAGGEQANGSRSGQRRDDGTSWSGSDDDEGPAELGDDRSAWVDESPDRGWIYSLRQPLQTLAGRVVYEPVRTEISRTTGDAGAPLRDQEGRLIGLVIGSGSPQVAALPIERAIEVADSLDRWGVGDLSWIGIETTFTPSGGGLQVVAVDRNSPAVGLVPGDLVLAVDGWAVDHPDHLEHLVRRAGPGGGLVLTVHRRGELTTIDVVVGTTPLS